MSRSPHREHRTADGRDRRLGATAQCRSRPYQMDVHNRKSPRENGSCLSAASGSLRSHSKSQNLCAEVLGCRIAESITARLSSPILLAPEVTMDERIELFLADVLALE